MSKKELEGLAEAVTLRNTTLCRKVGVIDAKRTKNNGLQSAILHLVLVNKELYQGEMVENGISDAMTISQCVKLLMGAKMVVQTLDKQDRRKKILSLTSGGKRRAREMEARLKKACTESNGFKRVLEGTRECF